MLFEDSLGSSYLYLESILSTVLVIVMVVLLPGAAALVWTNRSVKQLLFTGWTPIMCAMVISRLVTVVVHIGMFYRIILNVTDAACRAWCLKTLWIRTKAWPF